MVEYNKAQIGRIATKNGFVRDTFEKVLRLKEILMFINEHEYLSEHLLLKGGTAINMTVFNLPRLSVDIDMDFVPNYDREDMELARERVTQIIKEYMLVEGYQISAESRFRFSLDAFHFQYQNSGGNRDSIKIELNYSLRTHILEPVKSRILSDIFADEMEVLTLAPMEIFAAKANALMSRAAARDLYDFNNMEYYGLFDESERNLFRKCIIFYNTISQEKVNETFDTSAIDTIDFSKIKRDLFPVLRKKDNFDLDERKQQAKRYIKELMVVTPKESSAYDIKFILYPSKRFIHGVFRTQRLWLGANLVTMGIWLWEEQKAILKNFLAAFLCLVIVSQKSMVFPAESTAR